MKMDASATEPKVSTHVWTIKQDPNTKLYQLSAKLPTGDTGYATSSNLSSSDTPNSSGFIGNKSLNISTLEGHTINSNNYYEWYIIPISYKNDKLIEVTISGNTNALKSGTRFLGWGGWSYKKDNKWIPSTATTTNGQVYTSVGIFVANSEIFTIQRH